MLTIFTQLAAIKENGRQREKIALLRKYNSPTLRDVLFFAYSPTITFGVGLVKFDSESPSDPATSPSISEFLVLARKLSTRELAGDAALAAVIKHVNAYPPEHRNNVASLFAGKLSIGCEAEIINRALPGTVPVFGVQLAREFNPDHTSYPCFASAKFDGMRCLVFVTYNGVKLLTRTGKPIECLPHLESAFSECPIGVYDGELMHTNGSFNATVSACRTSAPNEESPNIRFHAFDYVPLPEWDNPVTPAKDRFARLAEIYDRYLLKLGDAPVLWFEIPHVVVKSNAELAAYHTDMLAKGYEGTMVQFNLPYSKKRSFSLMKLKEFVSTEAQIIDIIPGAGKLKNMIGAFMCRDTKSGVVFRCGSGFSDPERKLPPDYWMNRIIEVKYQELTPENKPRFPTFLRERPDLTPN